MRYLAISAAVLLASTSISAAQDMSLGEFEYLNSCAACHGADARGHGPLENMLNSKPSNLTELQKNNNDVFPVQRVYEYIDGTTALGSHGARDMPVWGTRYLARIGSDPDFAYTPEQRETYARTRILALIEYISTLQTQ